MKTNILIAILFVSTMLHAGAAHLSDKATDTSASTVKKSFKARITTLNHRSIQLLMLKNDGEKIDITISNHKGETVLTKACKTDGSFRQNFNFTGMEAGTYIMKVKKGQEEFVTEFAIR